jgi:hypothetical protein
MASPSHQQQRAHDALLKLHYADGWKVKTLAGFAQCSTRTMYQLLEEPSSIKLTYVDNLRTALAERDNYRLFDYLLPRGIVMARTEVTSDADGCVDDEIGDLSEAVTDLRRAKKRNDADAMAEARARIRQIERRLEDEEEIVRQAESGATVVHVSPGRGDGASEPKAPDSP